MFLINIPLPSLDEKTAKEIKKALKGMESASTRGPVRGGVISQGDAAAYALVWEWGNARQTKKGPKTTKGTNPDGESVWLSLQAPEGYIRISEPVYMNVIQEKLGEMQFSDLSNGDSIIKEMQKASAAAAKEIAEYIKANAPVDTGALRDSIKPADPKDPDLAKTDDELELGEGFRHQKHLKKK